MNQYKKSNRWLRTIELSADSSKKWQKSVDEPLDSLTKRRQNSLAKAAKELAAR